MPFVHLKNDQAFIGKQDDPTWEMRNLQSVLTERPAAKSR